MPELDDNRKQSKRIKFIFYAGLALAVAFSLLVSGLFFMLGKSFLPVCLTVPPLVLLGAWLVYVKFIKSWEKREEEKTRSGKILMAEVKPAEFLLENYKILSWRGPLATIKSRDGKIKLIVALLVTQLNHPPRKEVEVEVLYRADLPWLIYYWKKKPVFAYIHNAQTVQRDYAQLNKAWLFFVAMLIFNVGVLPAVNIYQLQKPLNLSRQTLTWPQTPGHILISEVHSSEPQNNSGKLKVRTSAKVFYLYDLASQHYTSNQIWIGYQGGWQPQIAEDIVQRYPEYSDVNVFYDPENPTSAVLEPGHSRELKARIINYCLSLISLKSGLFALSLFFIIFLRGLENRKFKYFVTTHT